MSMARQHVVFWCNNQLKQCVRPCASRTSTTRWYMNSARTFLSSTANNLERHWMPYSVNVGIKYYKIRNNWLRDKLTQIRTPPGYPVHTTGKTSQPIPATFRTICIDTAAELPDEVRDRMPTILCVHGSGGSHEDFIPLLKNLVDEYGFRAVCLNWPGYGKTEGYTRRDDSLFQYRSEDAVNFLLSFLQEIRLSRLDVVVGHSIGCVSASYVCARGEKPASLVLISPVPSQRFRGIEPYILLQTIDKLWRWKLLRPLLKIFVQIGYTGRGFSSKDPAHAISATLSAARLDFNLIQQLAMELEMKKLPKLFVYGGQDTFVQPSIQSEFAPKFGVKKEYFDVYNEKNELTQKGNVPEDHYSKGILFKDGGHVPHLKESHIPVLVKEILALYKHTEKKQT